MVWRTKVYAIYTDLNGVENEGMQHTDLNGVENNRHHHTTCTHGNHTHMHVCIPNIIT